MKIKDLKNNSKEERKERYRKLFEMLGIEPDETFKLRFVYEDKLAKGTYHFNKNLILFIRDDEDNSEYPCPNVILGNIFTGIYEIIKIKEAK